MLESQQQPPKTVLAVLQERAVLVLAAMLAVAMVALLAGPYGQNFAAVGIVILPLSLLAVLGHIGDHSRWARVGAWGLLAVVALFAAASFAVPVDELLRLRLDGTEAAAVDQAVTDTTRDIWMFALVGMGLAALLWLRPVRDQLARVLPIHSDRFAHTLALSLSATLIVSACAPLLVLGEPVFTALALASAQADSGTQEPAQLFEQVYQLLWMLPMCLLAVGYGAQRSLAESLDRLGLVRPTLQDIAAALGLALALAFLALLLNLGVDHLWHALGWHTTDSEGIQELMGYMLTPAGALVVGVCAGLGEELLVRGVLQPRLGIIWSNALFTAMHAGQYGWDLLLVIFAVGSIFGLVRKRTNTTISALVHGLYDVALISLAMA